MGVTYCFICVESKLKEKKGGGVRHLPETLSGKNPNKQTDEQTNILFSGLGGGVTTVPCGNLNIKVV